MSGTHLSSPPATISGVAASTRRVCRWDTPPEWLAPGERARAAGIRSRPARDAWLTARLAAKRLVAARLADSSAAPAVEELAAIEIRSRDAAGRGCRPRVFHAGREVAVALSIAHQDERVIVAVGPLARPLGVDLTAGGAFARASSRWWLTAAEQADARRLGPAAATGHAARLWSVKEAVYKAVLADEPFQPLAIEVRFRAGQVASCLAAGRSLPVAGIRCWPVAGHWLALVQAPAGGGEAEG
jgi:phosphopantetheinyl transferase